MNQNSSALRPVMIYGAILASAVLLGITLTSRLDYQSLGIFAAIFGLLVSPLLLRWHLLLLVAIWNSSMGVYFVAGQPPLWLLWSLFSLCLIWVERSFFRDREFVNVPLLTRALALFAVVVLGTMLARGGVGIRWIGSGDLAGGRKYLYILGAVIGYFALSLKQIPAERANLFIGLFFLGGVLSFVGPLAVWLGPPFDQLQWLFHPSEGVLSFEGTFRVKGLATVGMGIVGWLLSRYGFGGVFHQRRLWRPILLVAGIGVGLLSGYRTLLLLFALTVGGMFFMEGWHRTRWLWGWMITGLVALATVVPLTPYLPAPIQRAVAFLPLPVNPSVRFDAEGTLDWRYGLYDALASDVPRYFWLGKGMTISTRDMEWAETLSRFGGKSWDYAYLTGEHHNGFFSVIIAFGIWGMLAFLLFIGAGFWVLLQNYRFGEERLRSVNGFLLLNFIGWLVLFFSYWGTLYWSMRDFVGLLGLGVALNGGMAMAGNRAPVEGPEELASEAGRADREHHAR